jgi:hypothetical protein
MVQTSRMDGASTFAEKAEEAEKLAAISEQPWVRLSLRKLAKTYRTMAAQEAAPAEAPAGLPAIHYDSLSS